MKRKHNLMLFQVILCIVITRIVISVKLDGVYNNVNIDDCSKYGKTLKPRFDSSICPTLHGYIISNNIDRQNLVKMNLINHKIMVDLIAPISWKSNELEHAYLKLNVTGTMFEKFKLPSVNQPLERKMASNFLAFHKAITSFATDASASDSTWRFFFEDDVNVASNIPNVTCEIMSGTTLACDEGIIFLGVCINYHDLCEYYSGINSTYPYSCRVKHMKCKGLCAHAFGLTKRKAKIFMRELMVSYESPVTTDAPNAVEYKPHEFFFDIRLMEYSMNRHLIHTIGTNLHPHTHPEHKGIVYQDRINIKSTINVRN